MLFLCGSAKYWKDQGAVIVAGEGDVDYLCKKGGFSMFGETHISLEGAFHRFPAFTPDIAIGKDQDMVIDGVNFRFITIPGHSAEAWQNICPYRIDM
jgi:hypothetical protein